MIRFLVCLPLSKEILREKQIIPSLAVKLKSLPSGTFMILQFVTVTLLELQM